MSDSTTDNGKMIGIIAYLTLIGWIIAFVMHSNNKTELGAFHIRQMLGIVIVGFALYICNIVLDRVIGTAILGWVIQIAMFVFWLLGFMGALQGEKKPVPLLGEQFQDWFKGIG
jgi:uncharacterized membrane protein